MSLFFVLLSLLVPIIAIQIQFQYRRRTLAQRSWEGILSRAETVDLAGLRAVAQVARTQRDRRFNAAASDPWKTIGGFQGLSRLQKNATIMLELAIYAERMKGEPGLLLTEAIRQDAVRLKRAIVRTRISYALYLGREHHSLYLNEAAAAYCDLRHQLLGLYEQSHGGLMPRLEAAF